mgnify:CR=1 FL=1
MADPVRYRPHHFLCSLGFQGKGYSDGFTANMSAIVMGRLRADGGDETVIEVMGALDKAEALWLRAQEKLEGIAA